MQELDPRPNDSIFNPSAVDVDQSPFPAPVAVFRHQGGADPESKETGVNLNDVVPVRGSSGSNPPEEDMYNNQNRNRGIDPSRSLTGIVYQPMQSWSTIQVQSQENILVNQYTSNINRETVVFEGSNQINAPNKEREQAVPPVPRLKLVRKRSTVNLMQGDCKDDDREQWIATKMEKGLKLRNNANEPTPSSDNDADDSDSTEHLSA
jgi:hypothetical protein